MRSVLPEGGFVKVVMKRENLHGTFYYGNLD